MSWKTEARQVTQSLYGYYCNMCRELDIMIVPYHSFTFELYETIKQKAKETRRNGQGN